VSKNDAGRRRFMAEALPKADRVFFLNPELGRYVPNGQFLPYSSVDIAAIEVHEPRLDRPPRIVHAPSDGSIKGTAAILAALDVLRREREFEVVLVQNMTHAEALRVYQTADLVIDQVLAGWYGGFAVEAMAMGKPVLCYLREEDFHLVPPQMIADLPIRNVHPDHLSDDIAAALDRRSEWRDWSSQSRRFVEKWHDPQLIAAAMIDLYRDARGPFTLLDHIAAAAAEAAPQ
jgi:glycosyltransferase involved in cell wall biosynthesis